VNRDPPSTSEIAWISPPVCHDPVDRRQPEPGALPDFFRRVEGLEDPLHHVGRHAAPRVLDLQPRDAVLAHGADPQLAAERRRIACVDGQVHHDLFDL